VFGTDLAADPRLRAVVTTALATLTTQDARRAVALLG